MRSKLLGVTPRWTIVASLPGVEEITSVAFKMLQKPAGYSPAAWTTWPNAHFTFYGCALLSKRGEIMTVRWALGEGGEGVVNRKNRGYMKASIHYNFQSLEIRRSADVC